MIQRLLEQPQCPANRALIEVVPVDAPQALHICEILDTLVREKPLGTFGTARTIFRHVLPNIMAPMIITFTVTIGGVIMAEASLSFLGFGLPPNVASWGGMLSNDGRRFMELAPWLAIWPGLALTIVVYSLNMLGDALRDLLDPRLKGGVGRLGAAGARSV